MAMLREEDIAIALSWREARQTSSREGRAAGALQEAARK